MKISFDVREATPLQLARLEAKRKDISEYIRKIAGGPTGGDPLIVLEKQADGSYRQPHKAGL